MKRIAAVVGSSGIGKSKLAVELCKALTGQVINADALQVYKGLDIITNKMPLPEREGIPHHLMDFLDPEEEYQVNNFLKDASIKIDEVARHNQLPVVVGGTHYYVQSLLWKNTTIGMEKGLEGEFLELDLLETSELYERLKKADPVMANKWHPSDRRKILTSLKIFYQTGKPQSEFVKLQKDQLDVHGLEPRYKALIFWIYSDPANLNPRLDARVDQMIETGLFEEIKDLRRRVREGKVRMPGVEIEKYQRGLWQAIGYKEFDPFFEASERGDATEEQLDAIKRECTERMKAATRRYAKTQIKWIKKKLLPAVYQSKNNDVQIYCLDANDIAHWDKNVKEQAIEVAKLFESDQPLPKPESLSEVASTMLTINKDVKDTQSKILTWSKYTCNTCKTSKGEPLILNGEDEWRQHQKSRFHRKYLKHLKMEAMRQAHLEKKEQQQHEQQQ